MKVLFIISPRTHLLDLAGPDQVFQEAVFYGAPFEISYATYMEGAGSSGGLQFCALPHFSSFNLKKGDYVLVPGMDLDILAPHKRAIIQPFSEWLTVQYRKGVNVCSICTGAFLLAHNHLLDGRPCTTHWKYVKRLQTEYPAAKVMENVLFTDRDGVLTSAGIASGIDLALHIVEKELGSYMAHKVAREIVVYMRREGHYQQQSVFLEYRNHIHAGIHAVQDWLSERLHEKSSLEQLAQVAAMSSRNLTRTFKKETGITLGDYIEQLRLERIAELIKNPDFSRRQIAQQVGLTSERHLNRLIRNSV